MKYLLVDATIVQKMRCQLEDTTVIAVLLVRIKESLSKTLLLLEATKGTEIVVETEMVGKTAIEEASETEMLVKTAIEVDLETATQEEVMTEEVEVALKREIEALAEMIDQDMTDPEMTEIGRASCRERV